MKPVEFIQRNKFLIGVAVLVLAGIATVIGVFLPIRKANAATVSSLESKAKSLSEYASKAKMPSEADVPEAQKLTQAYEAGLNEVRAYLEKQDAPLEAPLKDQKGQSATDGSTWKLDYSQDVDNLLHKIQTSFLVVGDNPIVAQQYGSEIPDAGEMAIQTRYLRVQQFAIDAIASLNAAPTQLTVPVFNGFSFLAAPERLLSPAHSKEFTPIPFEIRVSTTFPNIPRVIYSLLRSPGQFEITSISIDRPDRLDRGAPQQTAWAARTQPGAEAAPKVAAAPSPNQPRAPGVAGPAGVPPGASLEPSAAFIAEMQALQQAQQEEARRAGEAQAQQGAAFAAQMQERMAGMMQNRPPGGGQRPSAGTAARRLTTARTVQGTEMTEQIKKQLPKTLVDLTIRGYVADYSGNATQTAAH